MIKSIHGINLQAMRDVRIDLPEKGLVRFRGENSNGKSILVKTMNAVIRCNLNQLKVRKALINYGAQSGQLIMKTYDGKELLVNISREAAQTYYQLTRKNGEIIKRWLADKDLDTIVEEFGFHYNKDREISLNIYNTYDSLLFLTTSHVTNYDMLNSALTDPKVERSMLNTAELLNTLKEEDQKLLTQSDRIEAQISVIKIYDVAQEKATLDRSIYLYENINALKNLRDIPELPGVADVSFIDHLDKVDEAINAIVPLESVPNVDFIDSFGKLDEAINSLVELEEELDVEFIHNFDGLDAATGALVELYGEVDLTFLEPLEDVNSTIGCIVVLESPGQELDIIVNGISALDNIPSLIDLESNIQEILDLEKAIELNVCYACGKPL